MPNKLLAISQFQREIDRLFEQALSLARTDSSRSGLEPAVDVVETEEALLILVEVPGLTAADLAVDVHGSSVRVSGEKKPPAVSPEARHARLERDFGRFEREIQITGAVNTHRGRAFLRRGVLTVELPKIVEQRQAPLSLTIEEDENE